MQKLIDNNRSKSHRFAGSGNLDNDVDITREKYVQVANGDYKIAFCC